MRTPVGKLVLEGIYIRTGCVRARHVFETESHHRLGIKKHLEELLFFGASIKLKESEFKNIAKVFDIRTDFANLDISLRKANRFDLLPYLIHTGRELDLMLNGQKPLAVFCVGSEDYEISSLVPIEYFQPYVERGVFLKADVTLLNCSESIDNSNSSQFRRFILYSLPDQNWRTEAYCLMQKVAIKHGWSELFERMEGALLGYEEWQNDIFIETVYNKGCGFRGSE